MLLPFRRQAHRLGQCPLPRPPPPARRRLLLLLDHSGTPELLLAYAIVGVARTSSGTKLQESPPPPDLLATAWICTPQLVDRRIDAML